MVLDGQCTVGAWRAARSWCACCLGEPRARGSVMNLCLLTFIPYTSSYAQPKVRNTQNWVLCEKRDSNNSRSALEAIFAIRGHSFLKFLFENLVKMMKTTPRSDHFWESKILLSKKDTPRCQISVCKALKYPHQTLHTCSQCLCISLKNFIIDYYILLRIFPLWGHCQEYKIEKNAILQERLLSEKPSTCVHYNLALSESICFADHEKQIQKFVAHWKVCQKSSQIESSGRMPTKRQNRKVCSSLRSISTSPGHWRTSKFPHQGRVLSDRRIDFQTTLWSRSQLESSAGKPVTSSQQSRHQDKNCVQLHHRARGWREAQLQRAKRTTVSAERRSFQSVNMIACLSAACIRKMATLQ